MPKAKGPMSHKDAEPDDPMELVGVVLPADPETMREMAYVFAEEFARMNYDQAELMRVFQNPFYAGPHRAYRALGEQGIRAIVDECVNAWGQARFSILDVGFSSGNETEKSKIGNPKSKMEGSGGNG